MVVPEANPKRVLVFGSVGQGKSSLVNLLVGENKNAAGASPVGVTFDHVESNPVRAPHAPNHGRYTFIDTAGLDESAAGSVKPMEALRKLAELLTSQEGQGFCLAIMVHKDSRLTSSVFDSNYEIFVDKILKDMKVPALFVKLGLEGVRDWEADWYKVPGINQKKETLPAPIQLLAEKYPSFKSVTGGSACTSCSDPRLDPRLTVQYAEKDNATRRRVWKEITAHAEVANVKLTREETLSILCQAWDRVCAAMEWFFDLKVAGWNAPWDSRCKKAWQNLRIGRWRLPDALSTCGFTFDEIKRRAF